MGGPKISILHQPCIRPKRPSLDLEPWKSECRDTNFHFVLPRIICALPASHTSETAERRVDHCLTPHGKRRMLLQLCLILCVAFQYQLTASFLNRSVHWNEHLRNISRVLSKKVERPLVAAIEHVRFVKFR